MQRESFKIIFGNEDNEVSVETLIACLLHTSDIINEANRTFGDGKKVGVNIKAFQQGSFEVQIELVQTGLQEIVSSLFTERTVGYLADLVGVVGGIYGLVHFLRGKRPKHIVEGKDGVRIENAFNQQMIFANNTFNLYNTNARVRNSAEKQFEALSKNGNVASFTFEGAGVCETIEKEDFAPLATPIEESMSNPPIVELRKNAVVLILRPSFSSDLRWDFVFEGQKLSAKMKDEALIKVVDEGEQFAKGDAMRVDLEVTKYYDKELGVHLITKDSYRIVRYIEHLKSPRQTELFREN